jgi:hypothetical protein
VAALVQEGYGEGAQRPQEVDAEDEVEAAEREADTGDGEGRPRRCRRARCVQGLHTARARRWPP